MTSEDEVAFAMYKEAWARARAAGATVRYNSDRPGGLFFPGERANGTSSPLIEIYRPWPELSDRPCRGYSKNAPSDLPPPDITHDLMILAHEVGHLRSWKGRTPRAQWDLYNAAAKKRDEAWDAAWSTGDDARARAFAAISDQERALIVEEEALAWEIARELLVDLQFTDWARFEQERATSLLNTNISLGIAPNAEEGAIL